MNRHLPANCRRFVCIAALLQLATPIVSAQFQMPTAQTASPPTSSVSDAVVPATSGAPATNGVSAMTDALIARTREAIDSHDYHTAVQAIRQLSVNRQKTAQQANQVAVLRDQLSRIGIDQALLNMPPTPATPSIQRLPDVVGALPIGDDTLDPKQQSLRLIAEGRAALDRGDVRSALALARRAESLRVPDQQFQPGEPRAWQLLLDAESAARRSGIALASGTTGQPIADGQPVGGPGFIRQADATSVGDDPGFVTQMLYTADADQAAAKSDVRQVQATEPLGQNSYAERMFYDGLDALTQGDQETARARFKEAWQYEADLSPTQRSQLKDKLTLLQPKKLGAGSDRDNGNLSPLEKADLEAQVKTRRLYREVTSELAKAEEARTSAPLDALDELQRLRRRIDDSDVDEQAKRSLATMVDRALTSQNKYIEANRAQIDLDLRNEAIRTERSDEQAREQAIDEEVSHLVETFHGLMNERRYPEAEVIAKQVAELKPDDPISTQLFHMSRTKTRIMMDQDVRNQKELSFLDAMIDVDRSAIAGNPDIPLQFSDAKDWESLSKQRIGTGQERDSQLSPNEKAIKQKMASTVSVKYDRRPLGEVLEDLSAMTGIPIVIDRRALSAVRVTEETPVSLPPLDNIKLQSALNLILGPMELTYMIGNDVLSITSLEAKRSRVRPVTYRVADLVTPIPNFTSSYEDGLAGALRAAYQMSNPQADVHVMPVSATDLHSGMAQSPTFTSADVFGQYNSLGSQGGFGLNNPPTGGAAGGGAVADFQSLIDLIQQTIVPDTWEALGGPSTMAPYSQNLSLVISTTSEVHDQIQDLLESLRRLQNLQITIEVRFITLADTFAEQIGVDFNIQFDDNVYALPDEDVGPSVVVGLGADGLPTADLDIRFNNGSFGLNPPFGAAGLGNPSTIGFAILSDIEAFFFLQAAQSDNRSNVMQAPKVTMFDGQIASIADQSQRPFVTSITPVVGDFAVAQQPVIVVLNEGTQLNVQGIVSDDKRFVRLTLVPFFSQIGAVDTFTFEGRRTTSNNSRAERDTNGDGVVDEEDTDESSDVIQGTTVQLPTFAFTTVNTTVSVPDGGTILLGGIKRLSEGRVERGVPVLSKIPYVSRLFRNVSAGRQSSSLMLMVTPRIIIQEEEELAQTGFDPSQN